jgi:hypothetical protein
VSTVLQWSILSIIVGMLFTLIKCDYYPNGNRIALVLRTYMEHNGNALTSAVMANQSQPPTMLRLRRSLVRLRGKEVKLSPFSPESCTYRYECRSLMGSRVVALVDVCNYKAYQVRLASSGNPAEIAPLIGELQQFHVPLRIEDRR